MHRRFVWFTSGLTLLTVAAVAFLPSGAAFQRPMASLELEGATAVVKLEFGLSLQTPRHWEGNAALSTGEILSIWGWHFIRADRAIGKSAWTFDTRLFNDPSFRYSRQDRIPTTVLPNGVHLAIRAPKEASISVRTNHGDFSFSVASLTAAGRLSFLDGDAAAVYTAPAQALTRGDGTQHDYPAIAIAGEQVFVGWVAFQNESNFVYLGQRQQGKWINHAVSAAWGDYSNVALCADVAGRIHAVWNEYKDDRWRLVSRVFDPASGKWDTPAYVAPEGRRQLFPRMTADAKGAVWIVWQDNRAGTGDIFAARRDVGGWSPSMRVSDSRANDWRPAIAASPDGTVYVAWDSYDQGNYDIFLRPIRGGQMGPATQVTRSENYEAEVSIAADPSGKLWMAWEVAQPNWGKDTGVLGGSGAALHTEREIQLVSYDGKQFLAPVRPLQQATPLWMSSYHEVPLVAIAPNGLPYLIFRHYMHRTPLEEEEAHIKIGEEYRKINPWHEANRQIWDIFITGFDGKDWLPVRQLPESTGRCGMIAAAASYKDRLIVAWPKDGRTYSEPYSRTAQIQYAEFPFTDKPAAPGMRPFVSERKAVADAASTEKADLARVRAAVWNGPTPLRLFRGDLHRHTDISADAFLDGDIYTTYRYAIDGAALDFLAITDHTGAERLHYYKYDWWRTRQIATMFTTPGSFASFFGYERTVTYPGGHRNIISTRRDLFPVPISDEEYTGVESYGTKLFPSLRKAGDIAIPHTLTGGGGTSWRENDSKAEPLAEVFQGLRGSYEEPGGPGLARGNQYPKSFLWNAWATGHKVGVITSSDHNSTHQSYACVWAPQLTPQAIHQALKQRRTYGATDNVVLTFEATPAVKMGGEIAAASAPALQVKIVGTAPLSKVELIRNGKILLSRNPQASEDRFSYREQEMIAGTAYYHVRAVQANKQIVWSSPIWVTRQHP